MQKIKIFSDKSYLSKNSLCIGLLRPFWFSEKTGNSYSWENTFESYQEIASDLFEMSSLQDADIAVLPFSFETVIGRSLKDKVNVEHLDMASSFYEMVEKAGKKILLHFVGPRSHENVPFSNAIVLRGALYKSHQKSCDIPLPRWTEDLIKYYCSNQLLIREKREVPTIGFCGYLHHDWLESRVKDFLYKSNYLLKTGRLNQSPFLGHLIRNQTIELCKNHSQINTNFIIRDGYSFLCEKSPEIKRKVRVEYVENLISSDYVICCRGSANTSIRLYETLCAGRIPVFINTDCPLPFETKIDWKKYCVWVEQKELGSLPEKIIDFHRALNPSEFIELQYECRRIWKNYLSPEGFYENLYDLLKECNL